jgi:lambda family phage minor tail protein L
MSDVVNDVNRLNVDSDLVELYMLQVGSGYVYFTPYHTSIVFRDYESPYTERTYVSLPLNFTGFEHKSDGAYARPRVTFANVLQTFENSIVSNDDLIGKKVIRRKTLLKYTGTGGSGVPTELPKQVFLIDRLEASNAQSVTFELTTPFDLAGIKVPNRYIVPNTCSWRYQGASDVSSVSNGVGGCTWSNNNNGVTAYFDRNNNLLISSSYVETTAHTGGSYSKDLVYKVSASGTRNNVNGTTGGATIYNLWQPIADGTGDLSSAVARRARQYTTYSGGTTYYTYQNGELYNDLVLYDSQIWVCRKSHSDTQTPSNTSIYWERADVCGKKLTSCILRFRSKASSANANVPSTDELQDSTFSRLGILPYGGFPTSRKFR